MAGVGERDADDRDDESQPAPFPEPERARFFEVNRTRIRGWCWGDPADPPVLLAHGAHDHGRMFDEFAPMIAELGLHVVAIDSRGHGDSGRLASGMTWTAATLDLLEIAGVLAEEAGAPGEPVGMIGHSMGGGQVLTAAATAPERVAWAVNLDGLGPPAGAFDEDDLVGCTARSLDQLERVRSRPPRVWTSRRAMADRRGEINVRLPRRFLDHLVAHGSAETEGGHVWKTDPVFSVGFVDGFSIEMVEHDFRGLETPVLVLTSTEPDAWTDLPDDVVAARVAMLGDARWHPVPGAGHYVHVERPEFVRDRIADFLVELGVVDAEARA